jgi:hypothetical protein
VSRNRRLYGGLVVHRRPDRRGRRRVVGRALDRSSEVTIAQGEIVHVQGYDLRFDRLTTREEPAAAGPGRRAHRSSTPRPGRRSSGSSRP